MPLDLTRAAQAVTVRDFLPVASTFCPRTTPGVCPRIRSPTARLYPLVATTLSTRKKAANPVSVPPIRLRNHRGRNQLGNQLSCGHLEPELPESTTPPMSTRPPQSLLPSSSHCNRRTRVCPRIRCTTCHACTPDLPSRCRTSSCSHLQNRQYRYYWRNSRNRPGQPTHTILGVCPRIRSPSARLSPPAATTLSTRTKSG
jgi:hypothetical protein